MPLARLSPKLQTALARVLDKLERNQKKGKSSTTGHELMCPSSWKLCVDDFLLFGSSLACVEPELELFEVWAE